jgi:integrase
LSQSTLNGKPSHQRIIKGRIVNEAATGFCLAREAAGRPDLRLHDLRHTGAVLAAQTGATLAELMARLGHSTPGAAMRYQHAARDRDQEIAEALSRMVTV